MVIRSLDKKGVFLDRDGVINRAILVNGLPQSPKSVGEIEILEGVVEAVKAIKTLKLVPVVITNQPDVARSIISQNQVDQINYQIGLLTGIEHFYTCFHDDSDKCNCRKPAPGLIYQAVNDLSLDIQKSYLVGDRWRDISAGQAVGCKTFFIDYGYPEKKPEGNFTRVKSLTDVVRMLEGELYGFN
jgi:D-glycero-D-manno-heptose 1,7-bisphosphate phosphatase